MPSSTPSALHPVLRSSGAHEHPDVGFVVPEHEVAGADVSLDHACASPDRDLDLDLTSLNPIMSSGEGWGNWPTLLGLCGPSISPDTGVGEYAGDGTIDLSVLGGGSISPIKVDEYASSPAGRRVDPSRPMDEGYRMDDQEDEDVIGLFAAKASDNGFVPPSGMERARAKAERSLWTMSSTLQKASALLQVRESRGRGAASRFLTKLGLNIGSSMTTMTMITKTT